MRARCLLSAFIGIGAVLVCGAEQQSGFPPNPIAPPVISIPSPPSPPAPPRIEGTRPVDSQRHAPTSTPAVISPGQSGTSGKGVPAQTSGAKPSNGAELSASARETAGFLSLLGLGQGGELLERLQGTEDPARKGDRAEALLERVLEKMDAQGRVSPSATVERQDQGSGQGNSRDQGGSPASPVSLLRCAVNGHDLIRSFKGPLVSTIAKDGSFLVTGDRFLILEGIPRRETVYLLYRPSSPKEGLLYIDVSQEVANPESFFKRLAGIGPHRASLIGDLAYCNVSGQDLVADIMFRVLSPTVQASPGR